MPSSPRTGGRRRAGPRGVVAALTVVGAASLSAPLAACGGGGGPDASEVADLTSEQRLGLETAQRAGCASCHGADFGGGVGPTWRGLAGSEVTLSDGTTVLADTAYLTEAIAEPAARIADGYDISMPPNDLDAEQVARIVAYIEALGDDG